jgi:hypothetical protein
MPEDFDPIRILAGLQSHGVSYVLVGGLGAAAHGSPVETDDVDICVSDDDENLGRLSLALGQLGGLPAPEAAYEHRVSFSTPAGRLDVLESPGEFEALSENAIEIDAGHGVLIRVAALDDLARLKRSSGDLSAAVRLSALAGEGMETRQQAERPLDPDPPPKGPIERILRRLEDVDTYLTEVNKGERPIRRKRP